MLYLAARYWYAEKGTGGTGGGFLNGALDNGFMPISESTNKMKFALMWANQDWVDIHPAKRGWSSTGRSKWVHCCTSHAHTCVYVLMHCMVDLVQSLILYFWSHEQ